MDIKMDKIIKITNKTYNCLYIKLLTRKKNHHKNATKIAILIPEKLDKKRLIYCNTDDYKTRKEGYACYQEKGLR